MKLCLYISDSLTPMVVLFCAISFGCTPQERVVRYKPFLTGVQGAQFGDQPPVNPNDGYVDPTAYSGQAIVINPDGSEQLVLASPRLVMYHLERLLDQERDQELLDRVVSEKTRSEFAGRGTGDEGILQFLKDNRKEIAKTFSRMPQAQHTPTTVLEQPGDRTWIIRLTDAAARDLKFTRLWVRQEGGEWKFLWLD